MGAIILEHGERILVTCVRKKQFDGWRFNPELVDWWDSYRVEKARELPPDRPVMVIGKHNRTDALMRNLGELTAGKPVQKRFTKNDDSARNEIEQIVRATIEARSHEAESPNPLLTQHPPFGRNDNPPGEEPAQLGKGLAESAVRIFVRSHLSELEGMYGQEAGNKLVELAKEEGVVGDRNFFLNILGALRRTPTLAAASPAPTTQPALSPAEPSPPQPAPPPAATHETEVIFRRGMTLREFVQGNLALVEGGADYAAGKSLAELGKPHGLSSNASSYYNYVRELRGTAPPKPAPAAPKLTLVPASATPSSTNVEELRQTLEGIFTKGVAEVLKAIEPILVETSKATARCSALEEENARLREQVQSLPDQIRQAIAAILQPPTSTVKTGNR